MCCEKTSAGRQVIQAAWARARDTLHNKHTRARVRESTRYALDWVSLVCNDVDEEVEEEQAAGGRAEEQLRHTFLEESLLFLLSFLSCFQADMSSSSAPAGKFLSLIRAVLR